MNVEIVDQVRESAKTLASIAKAMLNWFSNKKPGKTIFMKLATSLPTSKEFFEAFTTLHVATGDD
jgi:hypothetical protein